VGTGSKYFKWGRANLLKLTELKTINLFCGFRKQNVYLHKLVFPAI